MASTEVSHSAALDHAEWRDSDSSRDRKISMLDVMIVLANRKKSIFAITAGFAVLAAIVSLLLPSRYTATVTLLPPQQGSSLSSAFASQLGSLGGMAALAGGGLGLKSPNDLFVAMLKSRTVEDSMVQRFGLIKEYHAKFESDARKMFEKNSTVKGDELSGLINISVEDGDPKRAAEMANGYVDQFRKLSAHLAIGEASQRRLFFEQQLEQARDNLANAEEAMKRTEQKTGLIQFDSQARALIESAASLRAQIAAKEVQIQSLKTFATGQNAQLVQAEQELDGLQTQFAKLTGSQQGQGDGLIIPKGQVSEAGLENIRAVRDVKYYETIFDILARQYEMAKLDEAREGALVQVVDPAIPPDKRSFPKRALIVLGATVSGFILGILWVLFDVGFQSAKSDSEMSHKLNALRRALTFRREAV